MTVVWTSELIGEYNKCSDDMIYFAETYIKIRNENNELVTIILNPDQKEMVDLYKNYSIFHKNFPRGCGKTTISLIILLHQTIFKSNIISAIIGWRQPNAVHMCTEVTSMYTLLPEFLRPSLVIKNSTRIELDNGSKIMFESKSETFRGYTLANAYVDAIEYTDTDAYDLLTVLAPTLSRNITSTLFVLTTTETSKLFNDTART